MLNGGCNAENPDPAYELRSAGVCDYGAECAVRPEEVWGNAG